MCWNECILHDVKVGIMNIQKSKTTSANTRLDQNYEMGQKSVKEMFKMQDKNVFLKSPTADVEAFLVLFLKDYQKGY